MINQKAHNLLICKDWADALHHLNSWPIRFGDWVSTDRMRCIVETTDSVYHLCYDENLTQFYSIELNEYFITDLAAFERKDLLEVIRIATWRRRMQAVPDYLKKLGMYTSEELDINKVGL